MKSYTLDQLPSLAQKAILSSQHLINTSDYRDCLAAREEQAKRTQEISRGVGLFGMGLSLTKSESIKDLQPKTSQSDEIVWATDSYAHHGATFETPIARELVKLITTRSEKAKTEQRKRTRNKAEVFTPSWICNLQNNLIDDEILYPGAFNTSDSFAKNWSVASDPIDFLKVKARSEDTKYSWLHYVMSQRLEITCGEGPYLMSRYDTVTGAEIPVRDSEGRFQRIGLLDRKFRVIAENVAQGDYETWIEATRLALQSTYGYEWQGDNLLLARLNFVNTFVDYHRDFIGDVPTDLLTEVAEISSWQLWQMDGLKCVEPGSCDEASCSACQNKKRTGHNGKVSVIKWNGEVKTFEELLPVGS